MPVEQRLNKLIVSNHNLPWGLFVMSAFAASLGATVARLVAQPKMHEVEP